MYVANYFLYIRTYIKITGDIDYDAISYYYVTIPAGVTSRSFNYRIYNDDSIEGYETFYLYIYSSSLPDNVRLGNIDRTTVTIVDDDSE